MRWVGGAHAFHQFHPVSDPPVEHLHDIVRNAEIFHQRWGWWPMEGWLTAFHERGLITRDENGLPTICRRANGRPPEAIQAVTRNGSPPTERTAARPPVVARARTEFAPGGSAGRVPTEGL
jgi:hypothetical protein